MVLGEGLSTQSELTNALNESTQRVVKEFGIDPTAPVVERTIVDFNQTIQENPPKVLDYVPLFLERALRENVREEGRKGKVITDALVPKPAKITS